MAHLHPLFRPRDRSHRRGKGWTAFVSRVLVLHDEVTDVFDLGTLVPDDRGTWALEHEESGHRRHLKELLHAVTRVAVHVDELVIVGELGGEGLHVILDEGAGSAPGGRALDEALLLSGAHDGSPELAHILRSLERHLPFRAKI